MLKLCSLSAISLSLLLPTILLSHFNLPCLCLVTWLEMMLHFRETSLHVEQKSFPAETFRLSFGNSCTLATDFGSVEQEGFFLRMLEVPELCLTTCMHDSSDCCRAWRRSSSDGVGEELFAAVLKDGTTGTVLGSSLSLDEPLETTIGMSWSKVHDTLILTL